LSSDNESRNNNNQMKMKRNCSTRNKNEMGLQRKEDHNRRRENQFHIQFCGLRKGKKGEEEKRKTEWNVCYAFFCFEKKK